MPQRPGGERPRLRRLALVASLTAVALVAAIVVVSGWRSQRLTEADFQKVHPGMSYPEVQTALGGPPLFEELCWGQVKSPTSFDTGSTIDRRLYTWRQWGTGNSIAVMVVFNDDGAVVCRYMAVGQPRPFLARIRAILGL